MPFTVGRGRRVALAGFLLAAALVAGCQQPEDTEIVVGSGGVSGGEPPSGSGGGGPGDLDAGAGAGGASGTGGTVMVMVGDAGFDLGSDLAVMTDLAPPPDVAPVDLPAEMVVVVTPPIDASVKVMVPGYAGGPLNNTPQLIPGTIQCALFDVGGEGIAYHDTEVVDMGIAFGGGPAGGLRPGDSVDVGFTKDPLDRDPAQMPIPAGQPYVGWTHLGEWLKYTVNVRETGRYVISAMLSTILEGSQVSFSFEDGATTGPRLLPWTRGAHSWVVASNIGTVNLTAGLHVLMLRFELIGQNNVQSVTFTRAP